MDIGQEGHRSPLLVALERILGTSHSVGRRYQTKKMEITFYSSDEFLLP